MLYTEGGREEGGRMFVGVVKRGCTEERCVHSFIVVEGGFVATDRTSKVVVVSICAIA